MTITVDEFEKLLLGALKNPKDDRLKLLAPSGAEIEVELRNSESGRATKSTASLDSWLKHDGDIVIHFKRPKRAAGRPKASEAQAVTAGGLQSVDDQIIEALRTYRERNKFPFIALRRFKRELPLMGIDMPEDQLDAIISQMVTQGKLVLDKLAHPFDPSRPDTTAVRTPDMPLSKNWYK